VNRLPTENAIHHLIDSVRALNQPKVRGQPKRVDDIEARLLAAMQRDRTGSPIPDGYPSTTSGPIGNGSSSSVEAAVIALDHGAGRDWLHDLVLRATRALEDMVINANTLVSALASIDDVTRVTTVAPKTCEHCTPHLPKGNARPVHRKGTVGDRLTKTMDLCEPCYFYAQRSADAGSHEGELPTAEQVRHHDQTGTWRIRVA